MKSLIIYSSRNTSIGAAKIVTDIGDVIFIRVEVFDGRPLDALDAATPRPDETVLNTIPLPETERPKDVSNAEITIRRAKEFRVSMDETLQQMKAHRNHLLNPPIVVVGEDRSEVIAQHILSIRDLESAIMRQGMVLKNAAGAGHTPYPESYNPNSPAVEPTDGVKL